MSSKGRKHHSGKGRSHHQPVDHAVADRPPSTRGGPMEIRHRSTLVTGIAILLIASLIVFGVIWAIVWA